MITKKPSKNCFSEAPASASVLAKVLAKVIDTKIIKTSLVPLIGTNSKLCAMSNINCRINDVVHND